MNNVIKIFFISLFSVSSLHAAAPAKVEVKEAEGKVAGGAAGEAKVEAKGEEAKAPLVVVKDVDATDLDGAVETGDATVIILVLTEHPELLNALGATNKETCLIRRINGRENTELTPTKFKSLRDDIALLLNHKPALELCSPTRHPGQTALFRLVALDRNQLDGDNKVNYLAALEGLLTAGAKVSARERYRRNPLHTAAGFASLETVMKLIKFVYKQEVIQVLVMEDAYKRIPLTMAQESVTVHKLDRAAVISTLQGVMKSDALVIAECMKA